MKAFGPGLIRLCLLLPLLVGLSACGQKGMFPKGVQPVQIDRMRGPDRAARIAEARMAATQGELRCDFEGECHSSVALISIVTDQGLARCSGVLISEDEVLTNDHCVGLSLSAAARPDRFEEIPCEGDIFASFAAHGEAGAVRAECQSIRFRSGERGIRSVDYAVIRLKQKVPGRPLIGFSKKGLSNEDEVGIFRVQMDGDTGFGGTQSLLRCQASHRTFVYPQLDSADAPLMTLGDCPIVLGNSGAPVFNSAGELSGIIQGYLAVRQIETLENELREHLLDGTYGLTGVATQIHCLDRIGPGSPASCTELPALEAMSVKDFLSKYRTDSPRDLPAVEDGSKWYGVSTADENSRSYRSGPVCVSRNHTVESFLSAEVTYHSGIDSRLQVKWRLSDDEARSILLNRTREDSGLVLFGSGSVSLGIPACQAI